MLPQLQLLAHPQWRGFASTSAARDPSETYVKLKSEQKVIMKVRTPSTAVSSSLPLCTSIRLPLCVYSHIPLERMHVLCCTHIRCVGEPFRTIHWPVCCAVPVCAPVHARPGCYSRTKSPAQGSPIPPFHTHTHTTHTPAQLHTHCSLYHRSLSAWS